MKLFIDTGNINEIRQAAGLAILDGVTTNPSLIAKENKPLKQAILEICSLVDGPVSVEVTEIDKEAMMRQGKDYASWHKNVVVKLPTTREGVQACKLLSGKGIKINMTLCFSPSQALIVAKAGAAYVSPFVGRLEDTSANGLDLVRQIVQIYRNYRFETQVLAASLRSPTHVFECALTGAHVATMPWKVFASLVEHPLTDKGLAKFTSDWEQRSSLDEEPGLASRSLQ